MADKRERKLPTEVFVQGFEDEGLFQVLARLGIKDGETMRLLSVVFTPKGKRQVITDLDVTKYSEHSAGISNHNPNTAGRNLIDKD